jgi:hypothetical protein
MADGHFGQMAATDLKDWGGKTPPTLRHHLEIAESLKKETGGST